MKLPDKVSAGAPIRAEAFNQLIDCLRAAQIQPGPGLRVSQATSGTTLSIINATAQTTPQTPPPPMPREFLSPSQYGDYGFAVSDGVVAGYLLEDFTGTFTPGQDGIILLNATVDTSWEVSYGQPRATTLSISVVNALPAHDDPATPVTIIGRIRNNRVSTLNTHNKAITVTRWIYINEPNATLPLYLYTTIKAATLPITTPAITSTVYLEGATGTLTLPDVVATGEIESNNLINIYGEIEADTDLTLDANLTLDGYTNGTLYAYADLYENAYLNGEFVGGANGGNNYGYVSGLYSYGKAYGPVYGNTYAYTYGAIYGPITGALPNLTLKNAYLELSALNNTLTIPLAGAHPIALDDVNGTIETPAATAYLTLDYLYAETALTIPAVPLFQLINA